MEKQARTEGVIELSRDEKLIMTIPTARGKRLHSKNPNILQKLWPCGNTIYRQYNNLQRHQFTKMEKNWHYKKLKRESRGEFTTKEHSGKTRNNQGKTRIITLNKGNGNK
jgi:hypothetical protein